MGLYQAYRTTGDWIWYSGHPGAVASARRVWADWDAGDFCAARAGIIRQRLWRGGDGEMGRQRC